MQLPPGTPPTTRFVSIDRRGVIRLSDGSSWRVATHHHASVRRWAAGLEVRIGTNASKSIWDQTITNLETGEVVGAIAAAND